MYKIYINGNKLILADTKEVVELSRNLKAIFAPYPGKKKMLLSYIDMMEKTNRFDNIVLHSGDFKKLKKDFKSLFEIVPAGGGVVFNEKDEILLIRRNGKIDLPKGKLDKNESKKEAAIRETTEETNVKKLKLIKKLGKTQHVYKTKKGVRALKISHWYLMEAKKQKTKPEKNENITEAFWASRKELDKLLPEAFRSIREFIELKVKS